MAGNILRCVILDNIFIFNTPYNVLNRVNYNLFRIPNLTWYFVIANFIFYTNSWGVFHRQLNLSKLLLCCATTVVHCIEILARPPEFDILDKMGGFFTTNCQSTSKYRSTIHMKETSRKSNCYQTSSDESTHIRTHQKYSASYYIRYIKLFKPIYASASKSLQIVYYFFHRFSHPRSFLTPSTMPKAKRFTS